jgi:hypothetical protein
MWCEEYEHLKNILFEAKPEVLREQINKAEKETPELFAAFNMLALALQSEIQRLDSAELSGNQTILNVIPPVVVSAALKSQLSLPLRAELCDKLNKWATRLWYQKLRQGILEEPKHYCDD